MIFILILALLLGACSSSPTANPSNPPAQTDLPLPPSDTTPYPYPQANLTGEQPGYPAPSFDANANPYPMPTADYSTLIVDVTPDPTMGQVTGEILLNGKPVPLQMFFLADVLKDNKTGMELATSLDRSVAPRTFSDENGLFKFQNVPPGRYGLILLNGTDTYLLIYPAKPQETAIPVKRAVLVQDRKALKISPGSKVKFKLDDGRLIVEKPSFDPVATFARIAKQINHNKKINPHQYEEELEERTV